MAHALPIHDELHTGYLLACYGRGFVSRCISFVARNWRRPFTPGPSHVAPIVMHQEPKQDVCAWVFEMTTLDTEPDAITGEVHKGMQAHKFLDWLENYNGAVVGYPLKTPMTMRGELHAHNYALDCHKRQVEYDHKQAAGGSIPILNTENGDELYCSEFLAFMLQKGGSIPPWINASSQRPRHSIAYHCYDRRKARVLKG